MPNKKIKIIPALLARNSTGLKKQYRHLDNLFDYMQLDICDGRFVDNRTRIRPSCLKSILRPKDKLEIHLMVQNISRYITAWSNQTQVKKIIWHYEALPDRSANLALIKFLKAKKIKAGLAINLETSVDKIKNLIPLFETIQIMQILPGKQGRDFNKQALPKIRALRKLSPNKNISVDGGVNNKNIESIKKAGANLIAVGSFLQKLDYKGLKVFLERWTNK